MSPVEELILKFNQTKLNRELRDYYSSKSFLDILNKGRDEATHSGFIAWLLGGVDFAVGKNDSPLMNFLELIVRKNENVDQRLKKAVLSRSISFSSIIVKTEKKVKELSDIDTEDKLDVFVECDVTGIDSYNRLQIIIENKVTSSEEPPKLKCKNLSQSLEDYLATNPTDDELNGNYGCFYQTERYYLACGKFKKTSDEQLLQLFVYLSPMLKEEKPRCSNFTKISYQDILDYVITPLTEESGLSNRVEFILKEYIKCLSLPTEDATPERKRIVLAITEQEKTNLQAFCNDRNNIAVAMKCMEAILRQKVGCGLSYDENLLCSFFEQNLSLLSAASLACPNNAFSNAVNVCVEVNNADTNRYKPNRLYFVEDGKILDDTAVGVSFAKKFYDVNYESGDKAEKLNRKLADAFGAKYRKGFGFYSDSIEGTYDYEKHQSVYILGAGKWATTRDSDAGSKLMKYLTKIYYDKDKKLQDYIYYDAVIIAG